MSSVPIPTTCRNKLEANVGHHARVLIALLRRVTPAVLLIPVVVAAGVLACMATSAWWLVEKETMEIVGPCVIGIGFIAAGAFWVRVDHAFSGWLLFVATSLFCRELHFWGTNNGIYGSMLIAFWYLATRADRLRPFIDSRLIASLFFGAVWTYGVSKTFDRAWWNFLPGADRWTDSIEETLETAAHLCILSMAIASIRLARRLATSASTLRESTPRESTLRTRASRVRRLVLVSVIGLAAGLAAYAASDESSDRPHRRTGGFSTELSSVCGVHPDLGENLFLASSDEDRALMLCAIDSDGRPRCLDRLQLEVPFEDGESYHLDDLEDLAWDGGQWYYAVSSHRHIMPAEDAARMAKSHGTECAIVRFQLVRSGERIVVAHAEPVTRDLLAKIRALGVFESIDWTTSKVFRWRRLVKSWQVDVEGLAYVEGSLLLGFKNPVEHGRATILRYSLSDGALAVAARPDLGGHGILGLDYDAAHDRLLVVSNDPLKHAYGDSCLWIATRAADSTNWQFAAAPHDVLELRSAGKERKASGVTTLHDNLVICFDDESASPMRVIPLDQIRR
jgi:hypothetical protein